MQYEMAGRLLNFKDLPWERFLAAAVLIVSSVYLAIVLEGASTERDQRIEAIAALTDNRTVFPRKSSWTTMVADGQLAILGDPNLVSRLANLYEHSDPRLEYNGDRYDDTTQDILRVWLPQVWDLVENRFLTTDEATMRTFGNQMLQAQRQNRGYIALVAKWLEEVESVQMQVDAYLDRSGKGTKKSVN